VTRLAPTLVLHVTSVRGAWYSWDMERAALITEAHGNLLEADVDVLVNTVNTVNTVGIMGKGIALQFRRAFPAMYKDYSHAAKRREVALATMHVWPTGHLTGPRFVINFPTKGHWRSRSQLGDIDRGLDDLVRVIQEHGIRSIAIPPLGCGNGGLAWSEVEPLLRILGLDQGRVGHGVAGVRRDHRYERRPPRCHRGSLIGRRHVGRSRSAIGGIDAVGMWSPRKGRMFTPAHIQVAMAALSERGWTRDLVGVAPDNG
jgi:O-acetyl-ADP-ribose deacetylase (regulator of RNase III)